MGLAEVLLYVEGHVMGGVYIVLYRTVLYCAAL